MVARLTVGRPKYAEHEVEMQAVLAQAERLRGQMLALVDADTAAYENVMAAYRLPKDDDEQKAEPDGRDPGGAEARGRHPAGHG